MYRQQNSNGLLRQDGQSSRLNNINTDRPKTMPVEHMASVTKSYAMDDDYEPPKNSGYAKMAALARKQYLNPLARLDYEDREMEVFTKLTKQSQQTMIKKMKARNQLAEFQDEIDEDREIDDLVQFKFGRTVKPNQPTTYYDRDEEQGRLSPPCVEEAQHLPIHDSRMLMPKLPEVQVPMPPPPKLEHKQSSEVKQWQQTLVQPTPIQLLQQSQAQSPPQVQPLQPITRQPILQQQLEQSKLQQSKVSQHSHHSTLSFQQPQVQPQQQLPPQEPSKTLYCASCESFITEQQAEKHCRECFFDYSANIYEKKEQIIGKLEKIYRNLGELPKTPFVTQFRRILVDVTYIDDPKRIEELSRELSQLQSAFQKEQLLQRRAVICLQEKLQLRTFAGPRLGIFKRN